MTALLPCITVRQPWALVIATGHKTVENRGRPTSYRGPVGIHAARAHDPAGDVDPRILRLWGPEPRVGAPVGAVVAVAELVDCHEATLTGRLLGSEPCCLPWGDREYRGRPAWHLVLADARRLDWPVPARGSLAMPWRLPAEQTAAVLAQLAEVAS